MHRFRQVLIGVSAASLLAFGQNPSAPPLPTGQRLTPLAASGARMTRLDPHLAGDPNFRAGQAVTSALSPDGRTLLVLTSGYNLRNYNSGPHAGARNPEGSQEYVFVFDVSGDAPRQTQVLRVPNTYSGLAFAPSGDAFFVAGGDDDNVHVFALRSGQWSEAQPAVALGHKRGLGRGMRPEAAGLAVSADGQTIVVADYENDAVTELRRGADGWAKAAELDLRPGKIDPGDRGRPGGEFPYWVTIRGNETAYVSSVRDRQIVVVALAPSPRVTARIALPGQPNRLLLNRAQTRLYATQDNADSVAVIATASNQVLSEIAVVAPPALFPDTGHLWGANPNALALSPDERTLYVTNGGENAVAVVSLSAPARTVGLIPTGWYPNAVTLSRDGQRLFVINGKSDPGPNPDFDRGLTPAKARQARASNEYILQLEQAGLLSLPVPNRAALGRLTQQVLANDGLSAQPAAAAVMAGLRDRVHHVIYIIKENRTYDQVLGDLAGANGDPRITEFPEANTPNFHALARTFVALDHFECSGDVSATGWPWSTSARSTDVDEKEVPVNYADRGLSYDTEGTNRNVNLADKQRQDPDLLPGTANVAAPDFEEGDEDEAGQGYLWDAALRRHLTVRDYGFWVDGNYDQKSPGHIPELPDPAATHTVVAIPTSPSLAPFTDPYFRGFDQSFPDYYRFKEWEREFDQYAAQGDLPNLELVRLEHDHFGNFGSALDGLNTPELQIADDDYAVGLLVDKVAHSRYAHDTLIFIVEDDAQNGGDHVDAHRSPAFILGPYVKHHAVVSTAYTTVSLLRTMEEVLGVGPLNLHDAAAAPMSDAFDLGQADWSYTASPSRYLAGTGLPIHVEGAPLPPTHDGAYWARLTQGMDFREADHLDSAKFNQILWDGLKKR
ncbi:MAG TPA: beta-propeller fold lactonase family protein [Terriglobales bacterium]|nr:beta-propeller fold lactonase family protein [Terriglobales bacterium]